jgi:hypothetical protein
MLAQGATLRAIARKLERSPSTISREVRRNAATRGGALEPDMPHPDQALQPADRAFFQYARGCSRIYGRDLPPCVVAAAPRKTEALIKTSADCRASQTGEF